MAAEDKAIPRNKLVVTENPVFKLFVRMAIGKYITIILLIIAASSVYVVRHAALSSHKAAVQSAPSADSDKAGVKAPAASNKATPGGSARTTVPQGTTSAPAPKNTAATAQGSTGVLAPVQQALQCPAGQTGVPPNCGACTAYETGIYPLCVAKPCPLGYLGTEPNCTRLLP